MNNELRRGWTTGACATAAAKAAYTGLLTGVFPDPVTITLPRGECPAFALAEHHHAAESAMAAVVKDAGDDPDVTHGALVRAIVRSGDAGTGVVFRAGCGVGTVTRPGLPIPPGEPAINPVPRRMIAASIAEVARAYGAPGDVVVEIGVDDGARLAERTLNARLGIVGGLSILGTTGIVVPYSCAAWIDTIHRGIDVAGAIGLTHVAGATGRISEGAIRAMHDLDEVALIDMGDFVGGMLKYLRRHPIARVSIAGGIGKLAKLAQGRLDLHSRRGVVDMPAIAGLAAAAGADANLVDRIAACGLVAEALDIARARDFSLADAIAMAAWRVAAAVLIPAPIALEVVVVDRDGAIAGRAGFDAVHAAPPSRNRLR